MSDKKPVIIVSGGPGAGKTPAIKAVVACLAAYGVEAKPDHVDIIDTTEQHVHELTAVLTFWKKCDDGKKKICVCIHCDCDIWKCAKKVIHKFIKRECDLIICAAHGKQGDGAENHHKELLCILDGGGYQGEDACEVKVENGNWKKAAKDILKRAVEHIEKLQQ